MTRAPQPDILTVRAASRESFAIYAFELAAAFCGLRLQITDDPSAWVHVAYGDISDYAALRIPRLSSYTRGNIPRVPGDPETQHAGVGAEFPFDLVSAMRFWLADEGNAGLPDTAYDEHGRLLAAQSAQQAAGVVETPIVNAYLTLFRRWLEARTDLAMGSQLPANKRCVIALSHDVDSPIDIGDPTHSVWLAARSIYRLRRGMARWHRREAVRQLGARLRRESDRRWLFDDVIEHESHHQARSTFFFASRSKYDPEGNWFDVGYDIRAPRFRRLFRELRANGIEVALHIGYRCRDNAAEVRRQRELLEEVAETRILGSRHHYWHMSRPFWTTLEAHEQAGLRYDTSVAFNEAAGYRLGVALAYRPWNPPAGRAINVMQIPTVLMDGAIFYRPGATVETALDHVGTLVKQLKRFNGIVALDWHEYTSSHLSRTHREWGLAYERIVESLAADSEVALLPCRDVAALAGIR